MTAIEGRQLGGLARKALQFVAAGSAHGTQRVGLRGQQSQQVLLAARGIDQAGRIVGDQGVALVVQDMERVRRTDVQRDDYP